MPVIIRSADMKYKDSQGRYIGVNAVAERATADMIADIEEVAAQQRMAIEEAGAETIEDVEQAVADSQAAVAGIDAQRETMIAAIANVAGQGTDSTFTQPGVAADAAAVGALNSAINSIQLTDSIHEYINDAYTYTANDVESGSWSYATKSTNAKRLRNKVQIPVHKGMKIAFTNPTLQIDIAIYKVSGTYLQNTGWLSPSSTERTVAINTDGWLVILHQSSSSITVADYDSVVKLYSYPRSKATDVELLASNILLNTSDYNEMPFPYWEYGGMYGATGIEYSSDSRSITKFIPVKPGELLTIFSDVSNTLVLFQFESCVHSETNVNNIVCSTIDVVGQTTVKIDNNANYIRLMTATTPDVISGHVIILHETYRNRMFDHTYELTENDVVNGAVVASTGAISASTTRIRYNGILHVEAGATVHFVPGETTTSFWCSYRSNPYENFSNFGWMTGETTKIFDQPTDIILAFAKTDRTADILPSDFDCMATVTTVVIQRSLKTYTSLNALKNDTSIQLGQIVQTLGFNTPNDFGGGIYEAVYYSSTEPDNCSLFASANDGVQLKRIFAEPFVYLESLNYANVEYNLINTVIQRNGIFDVRCATIKTDKTIDIKDYDFTFGFITYTGNDCAILIDGVQCRKIYGNMLTADSAEFGVKVTCTNQNCYRNIIEINQIKAKDHGIAVRPVNTHGVQHNHYRINYIRVSKTGFSCYIPSGTGKYSWEGEELLTLNQILATNDDGNANAVHLEIEPDSVTGETTDGTITGLTFTNLSTESSDNGVYIHCGSLSHGEHSYNACIKSIFINNMRTREEGWTYNFLYGSGYIRDVYLKSTASLRFSQVNLVSSVGGTPVRIEAPIFYNDMTAYIGSGISSRLNKKYITKRKGGVMNVEDDVDFTYLGIDHIEDAGKTLFYPDQFYIADSVLGNSVHINLMYLMDESADGIIYSIPGKAGNDTATVEAEYMSPHKTITLTNNNADRHLYQVRLLQGQSWSSDWKFQIIDLGVADAEITLPYNYNEDNA